MMSIPGGVNTSADISEELNSVTPLLSPDGRDFLDGRINAQEYIEIARRDAAIQAQREFQVDVKPKSLRDSSSPIFVVAAFAYILYGVSLIFSHNLAIGLLAIATAAILAPIGAGFRAPIRSLLQLFFLNGRRRVRP
jgi:hypothetical protein